MASRYSSTGSDENKGVEAAEKGLETSSKLIHGIKNYSDKRRMKKSKLEFREAKEEIKKNDEYKKASAYKKFQKRKQMKAAINGSNQTRIRDRIKKGEGCLAYSDWDYFSWNIRHSVFRRSNVGSCELYK